MILTHVYLPAIIPSAHSSLSLGFSLAIKVIVMGEYIAAQDGIGYLLNRAQVTLNMREVFFYLLVLFSLTLIFQIILSFFFSKILKKYSFSN